MPPDPLARPFDCLGATVREHMSTKNMNYTESE